MFLDIVFWASIFCGFVLFMHLFLMPILDVVAPSAADAVRLSEHLDDAARRGLSYRQAADELEIRTIWSKIRHTASAATILDASNYTDHIDEAIKCGVAELKAMRRGDLIPGLLAMNVGPSSILNRQASRAVDKYWAARGIPEPDPMLLAFRASALRVER